MCKAAVKQQGPRRDRAGCAAQTVMPGSCTVTLASASKEAGRVTGGSVGVQPTGNSPKGVTSGKDEACVAGVVSRPRAVDNKKGRKSRRSRQSSRQYPYKGGAAVRATWQTEKTRWRDIHECCESNDGAESRPGCNVEAPEFVPREQHEAPNRRGPKGLTGMVEGVHVEFLSDTGAESTVLSTRCYETLPYGTRRKFQDSVSSITMPDGQKVVSKGPVLCEITVGSKRVNEVVFVADIEDYALLGWDAQLALGVQYTVAGVDLVGGQKLRRVYNPIVRRVKAAEDCVIPPRSEVVARGEWPALQA